MPAAGPPDVDARPRDWLAHLLAEPRSTLRLEESVLVELPAIATRVDGPV